MSDPEITVIVQRFPDESNVVQVFVGDTALGDYHHFELDGGAGYEWGDWCENRDADLAQAELVGPNVLAAVTQAYADPPGYKYINKPDGVGWLDAYDEDAGE